MRRKLDKKLCRRFANPDLHFSKDCGILHCEQVKFVIRTVIKNIGRTRTLVLYLFSTERAAQGDCLPTYVIFQTKEDFVTLENVTDGSIKWRVSSLDNFNRRYDFERGCAFYKTKDEETVKRFCGKDGLNGFGALNSLQSAIQAVKRIERREKKELAILHRMQNVPSIPRGLNSYIHKSILPQYIFYDYTRAKKPIVGYCTACNSDVSIIAPRYLKEGVCPRCKSKIRFKSRGKRGYFYDRTSVQVIQRTSEQELVIRIFKIYNDYFGNDVPMYHCYESARIFVSWVKNSQVEYEPYYNTYYRVGKTPWAPGYRPRLWPYQYSFEGDCCAHLYQANLDQALLGTPWQYSQLKFFTLGCPGAMEVVPYLQAYCDYPVLEYLVKLKLYRLADSMVYRKEWNYSNPPINLKGRDLQEVLGLKKDYLPLLQEIDPQGAQFRMLRQMIKKGRTPNVPLVKWCAAQNIVDADVLNGILKYMSNYKLMQYADEQFSRFRRKSWSEKGRKYNAMKDMLSDYRDYLAIAELLEFDLKNDFVLFPRNLPEAHDKVNELSDKLGAETHDKAVANAFAELASQYQYEKGGLMIIPPHSAKEIVEEGHALHHCVGSYVKRVIKRQTVILFVRQTVEPAKPFCTVELRDGEVAQARMNMNQAPPPKVKAFLDEWKENVLDALTIGAAA